MKGTRNSKNTTREKLRCTCRNGSCTTTNRPRRNAKRRPNETEQSQSEAKKPETKQRFHKNVAMPSVSVLLCHPAQGIALTQGQHHLSFRLPIVHQLETASTPSRTSSQVRCRTTRPLWYLLLFVCACCVQASSSRPCACVFSRRLTVVVGRFSELPTIRCFVVGRQSASLDRLALLWCRLVASHL